MARGPTGILRNSPAYFVAAAGLLDRMAASAIRPAGGKNLFMNSSVSPRSRPDDADYAGPESAVNRSVDRLPVGHARFAEASRDARLAALSHEFIARAEAHLLARAGRQISNLVGDHHPSARDGQRAKLRELERLRRRQEPQLARHRQILGAIDHALRRRSLVSLAQRLPVGRERAARRGQSLIHPTSLDQPEQAPCAQREKRPLADSHAPASGRRLENGTSAEFLPASYPGGGGCRSNFISGRRDSGGEQLQPQ